MAGEITVIPWADLTAGTTAGGSAELIIREGGSFTRITKDNLLADVSSPAIAGTIDFTISEVTEDVTGPTLNAVEGPRYTVISGDVAYVATFANGVMSVPAQTDAGPSYRCTGLGVLNDASAGNSKNYANFRFGNLFSLLNSGEAYVILGVPNGSILNISALVVFQDGMLLAFNHLTNTPTVISAAFDPNDAFRLYWDVAANTIKCETVDAEGVSTYTDITPTVPLTAGVAAMASAQGMVANAGVTLTMGISAANNFGKVFNTLAGYTPVSSTVSTTSVVYPAIPLNTKENTFYKASVGVSPRGGGYINPDNSEVVIGDGDVVAITKNGGGAFIVGNVIPAKQKSYLGLQPDPLSLANTSEEVPVVETAAFLTKVTHADFPAGSILTPDGLYLSTPVTGNALAEIGDAFEADTKAAVFFKIPSLCLNSDEITYPDGVVNNVGLWITTGTSSLGSGLLTWKSGSGLILKNLLNNAETVVDAAASMDMTNLVHIDVPNNKIIVRNSNGLFEVTPYVPLAAGQKVFALIMVLQSAANLASNYAEVRISGTETVPSGLTPEEGFTFLEKTTIDTVVNPPTLPANRKAGYVYEISVGGVWTNTDGSKIRFSPKDLAVVMTDIDDLENLTDKSTLTDYDDIATFHPTNHTPNVTFSDDLLTVTHTTGEAIAVGSMPATGSMMFEVTKGVSNIFNIGLVQEQALGLTTTEMQTKIATTLVCAGATYVVVISQGNNVSNSYPVINSASLNKAAGAVIGVTYSSTTGIVEFFVDGVKAQTSGAMYFPYYYNTKAKPLYHSVTPGSSTANFGATPFAYPQAGFTGYIVGAKKYNGPLRMVSTDWNPGSGYPTTPTPMAGDLHYARYGGNIGDEVFVEGNGVVFDGNQWRRITEIVPMDNLLFLGDYPAVRPDNGVATVLPVYQENAVYRIAYQVKYKDDSSQDLFQYFLAGSTIVGRNGKWEYLTVNALEIDDGVKWPTMDVPTSTPASNGLYPMLPLNASSSDDKVVGIYEFTVDNPTPWADYEPIFGLCEESWGNGATANTSIIVSVKTGKVWWREAGGTRQDITNGAGVPLVAGDVVSIVFETYDGTLSGNQNFSVYKNGKVIASNTVPDYTQFGKGPFWLPFSVQVDDITNSVYNTADSYARVRYNTGKMPFKYAPAFFIGYAEDLTRWSIPLVSEKSARARIYPMSMSVVEIPASFDGGVQNESLYAQGITTGITTDARYSTIMAYHNQSIKDTYGRKTNVNSAISSSFVSILPETGPTIERSAAGMMMLYPAPGDNVATLRSAWGNRKALIASLEGNLIDGGAALANLGDGYGSNGEYAVDSSNGKIVGPKVYGSWLPPLHFTGVASGIISDGGLRFTKPANHVFSAIDFGFGTTYLQGAITAGTVVRPSKHTLLIRMKSILREVTNPSEVWMMSVYSPPSPGFSTTKAEFALYRYHDRAEIVGTNGTIYNEVVNIPWVTGTDEVWGFAFDEDADTVTIIKPDQTALPAITLGAENTTHEFNLFRIEAFSGNSQFGDAWEAKVEDINDPALSGYILTGYGAKMQSTVPTEQWSHATSIKALEIFFDTDGNIVFGDWKVSDLSNGTGRTIAAAAYGHNRKFTVVSYGYNHSFTVYDDNVASPQQLYWSITAPAGAADGGDFHLVYFDSFRFTTPLAQPSYLRGFKAIAEKRAADYAYRGWDYPSVPTWAKPGTLLEATTSGTLKDSVLGGVTHNVRNKDILLVGQAAQLYRFTPMGGDASDQQLIEWARTKAYFLTNCQYDGADRNVTANVTWPDGKTGTYTVTAWAAHDNTIPVAWNITYGGTYNVLRVSQPEITYFFSTNTNTNVIYQMPMMTVTPVI